MTSETKLLCALTLELLNTKTIFLPGQLYSNTIENCSKVATKVPEITTNQVVLNYDEETVENPERLNPWQKYSPERIQKLGRGVIHMVGEPAGLSRIDLTDIEDILRLDQIDKEAQNMDGDTMSFHQLIDWAKGGQEWHFFAIRGTASSVTKKSEISELQGWIQTYYIYDYNIARMFRDKMIPKDIPKDTRICEVSYAKFPQADPHQIASGLRQAILLIAADMEVRNPHKKDMSEKPLLIRASVDPKNIDSVRVLKSCGFVKVGRMPYEEHEQHQDDVYILDWNKFYNIVDEKVMRELGLDEKANDLKRYRQDHPRKYRRLVSFSRQQSQ